MDGAAASGGAIPDDDTKMVREVWFGEPVLCPVIGRHDLGSVRTGGDSIGPARPGPFIVEETDCTVVVPPGWSAVLDDRGFILMARIGRLGDHAG